MSEIPTITDQQLDKVSALTSLEAMDFLQQLVRERHHNTELVRVVARQAGWRGGDEVKPSSAVMDFLGGNSDTLEKGCMRNPDGSLLLDRKGSPIISVDRSLAWRDVITRAMRSSSSQQRPIAVAMAGGVATGKTTTRGQIDLPDAAVIIDPDDLSTQLPDYQALRQMNDPSIAPILHREKGELQAQLLQEAIARRANLVLDTTGSSLRFIDRLQAIADEGYAVHLVYTDCALPTALHRATKRGYADYRFMTDEIIAHTHSGAAATFPHVVERTADLIESLTVWSTEGPSPQMVASTRDRQLQVHMHAELERFLDKAHGHPDMERVLGYASDEIHPGVRARPKLGSHAAKLPDAGNSPELGR